MVIIKPQYLLVTNQKDITSDFLVRELQRRDLPFYRLNTETLPESKICTQSNRDGISLHIDGIELDTNHIKSAYFRRPGLIEIDKQGNADAVAYRTTEWTYILRSFYLELGPKWFSHPNNILLGENKPGQLRLAQDLGFSVPDYVITNTTSNLHNLFATGPVIAKPLSHNLLDETDDERVIFTVDTPNLKEIENMGGLSQAPVIFQRRVEKLYDLRVTVVGNTVFAVQIDSQTRHETKTDWRAGGDKLLAHELVDIPSEIKNRCIALIEAMNIRYGAIDLIQDLQSQYWFLECNPNGQWAWIENVTGAPISKLIVDELIACGDSVYG